MAPAIWTPKGVWWLWGGGTLLLAVMPTLLTLLIMLVRSLSGSSLWVQYDEAADYSLLVGSPLLVAFGNWPLFLLPLFIRMLIRKSPDKLQYVVWALCGALLAMAAANIPLWAVIPEEAFDDAYDAGEGAGIFISLLFFAAPFICAFGWTLGMIASWGWSLLRGK